MNKRKRVADHKHRIRAKKLAARNKAAGITTATPQRATARAEARPRVAVRPSAAPAGDAPTRRAAPRRRPAAEEPSA